MLTRKTSPTSFSRAVVLATAAALVLTVAVPPPVAQARPAAPAVVKDVSAATTNVSEATDFSARRRVARRGYRNNNAAGLAFMGLALGTVGAVIANQQRRDYYRQNHYYGGNPYYGGGYYAQPQPYYGGGYYGY